MIIKIKKFFNILDTNYLKRFFKLVQTVKINKNFYSIYFLFFSILIASIWLNKGQLANGEEGLSIFNNISFVNQTSAWQSIGTGILYPHYITRAVPVLFTKLLTTVVPLNIAQLMYFSLNIFIGMYFMYLFLHNCYFDKDKSRVLAIFITLFYFLNLYTQSQVWQRFLYAGMALWAFVPVVLYVAYLLLKGDMLKGTILLILINTLLSVVYLQPSNIIVIHFIVFSFFASMFCYNLFSKKAVIISVFYRWTYFLFVWVVINLWWFVPYFKLNQFAFQSQRLTWQDHFNSLIGVSKYFGIDQILFLRQNHLFGQVNDFYGFYSHWSIYLASSIFTVLALLGVIYSLKKLNYKNIFILVIFVFGLFFSKGTNPPLGYLFFNSLFSNFPIFIVFRNSYEKFGMVFVLGYSLLLGIAIEDVIQRTKLKKLTYLLSFLILFILTFPIWTGLAMTSKAIKIPEDYTKTESILIKDKNNDRILHLPLNMGDSVQYNWGYSGIEPSEYLFSKASISKFLREEPFDSKYKELFKAKNKDELLNILKQLNVKYIVLHKDIISESNWNEGIYSDHYKLLVNNEFTKLYEGKSLVLYKINIESSLFELYDKDGNANMLTYTKVSNTKYHIKVNKVTGDRKLVYKMSNNAVWVAEIQGVVLERSDSMYNYTNTWIVPSSLSGKLEVKIK